MSASLIYYFPACSSSIEFAAGVCKKVWLGVRVECATDALGALSGCVVVVRHVNELLSLLLGQLSSYFSLL